MDWTNERYVRLYTRDTDDWLALKWEAKALFPLMLRKVDRSGYMETKRGVIGVAAQTGLPLEVVQVGLPDLLRDGSVTECDGGFLMPNYIDAQEAPQSDAQRARESRERRRDRKRSQNGTDESQRVAEPSHAVTRSHALSHGVTPAVPSQPSEPASSNSSERPPALRLVIAANQATTEKFGEQTRPLLPGHTGTLQLVDDVSQAGVPIDFAERSVARQVGKLKAPVKTMAYFRLGILEDWASHNANVAAGAAPRVLALDRSARNETRALPRGPSPPAPDDGVVCRTCGTKETEIRNRRIVPKHLDGCALAIATSQVAAHDQH